MKAIVIGCPGGGKSTFAKKLSKYTKTPLCYLDLLNWNGDKTAVAREIFDERLSAVLQKDEWIIDGNYMRTMEMRMTKADVIFYSICRQIYVSTEFVNVLVKHMRIFLGSKRKPIMILSIL